MKIILLEDRKGLGGLGAVVDVKAGYARNFLIPQKRATFANKANLALFEQEKDALLAKRSDLLEKAKQQAESMANVTCTISAQAGDEGKLFGSVGTTQIIDSLAEQNHTISKQDVKMPNGAIRHIGDYEIDIVLHAEVDITIKVSVVAS